MTKFEALDQLIPSRNHAKFGVPDANGFFIPQFLSRSDCNELIIAAEKVGFEPSFTTDHNVEWRTSSSMDLQMCMENVAWLEDSISDCIGLLPTYLEPLQIQRYEVGQFYKPHTDFFKPDPYGRDQIELQGNRTWTFMIYLNDEYTGGRTMFGGADPISLVGPKAGDVLCWNNFNADGTPNPRTIHESTPVLSGVKYVLTAWFRERSYLV